MKNLTTKKITLAAISISLVFVATYTIAIPIGNGFINPSEIIIMVIAILFGPLIGSISGIGAGIADIALGFASWAPFTLFTKVLTGFLVGRLSNKYMAMAISSIVMVLTYSIGELVIYNIVEPSQLIANIIQCTIAVAISVPISIRLKNKNYIKY